MLEDAELLSTESFLNSISADSMAFGTYVFSMLWKYLWNFTPEDLPEIPAVFDDDKSRLCDECKKLLTDMYERKTYSYEHSCILEGAHLLKMEIIETGYLSGAKDLSLSEVGVLGKTAVKASKLELCKYCHSDPSN